MIDANTITQLIGSLGFPIAACCAMFWKMNKSDEAHAEEMNKMSEALANNTLALTKLTDMIEKGEKNE